MGDYQRLCVSRCNRSYKKLYRRVRKTNKINHMATIVHISAREILNSKGNPAVEATVILSDGTNGSASCPSGTSVGTYEAMDLKDHDEKRYKGGGVLKAVSNVQTIIAPKLIGVDAAEQSLIDKTMIALDATPNKSNLGANAILPLSIAICKAEAKSLKTPLYQYIQRLSSNTSSLKVPAGLFNLINGGKHAGSNIDFQEFLVIPASSKPFSEALRIAVTIQKALGEILTNNGLPTLVGDEGGFGPKFAKNTEALDILKESADRADLDLDWIFSLALMLHLLHSKQGTNISSQTETLSTQQMIFFLTLNSLTQSTIFSILRIRLERMIGRDGHLLLLLFKTRSLWVMISPQQILLGCKHLCRKRRLPALLLNQTK